MKRSDMENTQNYLQVLSESLDKKTVILKELQRLTGIQKEIVEAEEFDDEAFNANVEMKAALITELQKMDNGFQILYNNTKDQLESGRERYASEIKVLQQKISVIMDLNASLQVAEANNKKLVEKRFAALRKEVHQVKKSKATAANYYKTMNNITSEPYFLDKKN